MTQGQTKEKPKYYIDSAYVTKANVVFIQYEGCKAENAQLKSLNANQEFRLVEGSTQITLKDQEIGKLHGVIEDTNDAAKIQAAKDKAEKKHLKKQRNNARIVAVITTAATIFAVIVSASN